MASTRRLDRVNKEIQRIFGHILLKEADLPSDVLVTVSGVDTTANLQSSTIWLYISPLTRQPAGKEHQRAEEVLKALNDQLYHLQGILHRRLSMRPLPRITLQVDHGAQHTEDISRRLDQLHRPNTK